MTTVEEVLEAIPGGDLQLTLRDKSGARLVTGMPIRQPEDASDYDGEDFGDSAVIRFKFDDPNPMGGVWPVDEVSHDQAGTLMLIGPKGTAYIRTRPAGGLI